MDKNNNIGVTIKEKRLQLNITMNSLCKKVGISRATLSSIENGYYNCSVVTILKIFHELNIDFTLSSKKVENTRKRATRINTILNKKINRFIVMCIEEYAEEFNLKSNEVYKRMNDVGLINEIKNDYNDLHGMSKEYLNQYFLNRLKEVEE